MASFGLTMRVLELTIRAEGEKDWRGRLRESMVFDPGRDIDLGLGIEMSGLDIAVQDYG